MGPNICPSGPCMVKSGINAHTMMAVEKNSPRSTSCEAWMIRSRSGNSWDSPAQIWREMFFTTMKGRKTTKPKVTGPGERKICDVLRRKNNEKAKNRAKKRYYGTIQ